MGLLSSKKPVQTRRIPQLKLSLHTSSLVETNPLGLKQALLLRTSGPAGLPPYPPSILPAAITRWQGTSSKRGAFAQRLSDDTGRSATDDAREGAIADYLSRGNALHRFVDEHLERSRFFKIFRGHEN